MTAGKPNKGVVVGCCLEVCVGNLAVKVGQRMGFQSLNALMMKKLPVLEAGLRTFAVELKELQVAV